MFVVAVLLTSSAILAENPSSSASDEAFLNSLQEPSVPVAPEAPALTPGQPAPVEKACTYQCQKCGTNRVRLCSLCNGVTSCEACHTGTVCAVKVAPASLAKNMRAARAGGPPVLPPGTAGRQLAANAFTSRPRSPGRRSRRPPCSPCWSAPDGSRGRLRPWLLGNLDVHLDRSPSPRAGARWKSRWCPRSGSLTSDA